MPASLALLPRLFNVHCMRILRCEQGETDCMREDTARTYFDRFQTLVGDVRGLYPDLKIFTVAVTGTTPRLPHLVKVRLCLA